MCRVFHDPTEGRRERVFRSIKEIEKSGLLSKTKKSLIADFRKEVENVREGKAQIVYEYYE